MMELELNDWERLNAYVDGELAAADAAALEARLADHPDLKRDLDRIRTLKTRLAELRPAKPAPPAQTPATGPRAGRYRKAAAVATGLLVAVALAGAAFIWRSDTPGWLAETVGIHERLSRKAYVVEEHHIVRLVSTGRSLEFHAPDLTGSRLFLVDVVTARHDDRETIAMHYRGMRGCRLTVVAIEASADSIRPAAPSDALLQTWSHGGFIFAVVANGMDPRRFQSVADYVKAEIEESAVKRDALRTAMIEDYRRARPCA